MADERPDFSTYTVADDDLAAAVRALLKRKRKFQVNELADRLDVAPKHIRRVLVKLRESGFRIPEEVDGLVELLKVPPTNEDAIHELPLTLLDGDLVRFGVVSDTHLGSKECALAELSLAYDWFEREGVDRVLHAGDLVAGVGVFKGQHNELTHHTFEDQVAHAVEAYPQRNGITTLLIGGNHDLEGDYGRIGADPVQAAANKRDDLQYLDAYSAWLELANGAYVHLLHSRGGMSYAYSYKAQKLAEGYGAGRKPGALIVGHFHVQGNFEARGIQVMFPACFEFVSRQFGVRLGHRNSIGFHLVEARLADDGSIVEWTPRWFPLWEGRKVVS